MMIDWRFLIQKYVVKQHFAYGCRWTNGTWLSDTEEFNEPLILQKSSGDFLDIGACFGMWSIRARDYYRRIVAFEPDPRARRELFQNIRLNDAWNVSVMAYALGRREAEQVFHLYETGESSLLAEHMGHKAKSSVTVKVKTVDMIVQQLALKPSLLKLDVEGAEADVLSGAQETVRLYSPRLVIEVHHPTTILDVENSVGGYDWKIRYRYLNQNVYPFERQAHLLGVAG